MNSTSYQYESMAPRNGAQLVLIGIDDVVLHIHAGLLMAGIRLMFYKISLMPPRYLLFTKHCLVMFVRLQYTTVRGSAMQRSHISGP